MKTILIALFIKILLVDGQTHESLPGVRIDTNKHTYYSDLDGYVYLANDEKINTIGYISYNPIKNITATKDTTIYLSPLL